MILLIQGLGSVKYGEHNRQDFGHIVLTMCDPGEEIKDAKFPSFFSYSLMKENGEMNRCVDKNQYPLSARLLYALQEVSGREEVKKLEFDILNPDGCQVDLYVVWRSSTMDHEGLELVAESIRQAWNRFPLEARAEIHVWKRE